MPTNPRDDDELMALFLEESGERFERLAELIGDLAGDGQARIEVSRQLHALKGASRMMGLVEIAGLCHRVEDLLEDMDGLAISEVERGVFEIRRALDQLSVPGEQQDSSPHSAQAPEPQSSARSMGRDELRVASKTVDDLADRGARLRVVAVAAEGLASRIFRLATLAEQGTAEPEPIQVLATLATSLRQIGIEFETGQRIFRRLSDRQLDALLRLQIQPLTPFLHGLADHARELGTTIGKEIEIEVEAGEAHLDRRIVNSLREAFLHLVRNAVDHGIERPEERLLAGKNRAGRIRIEAISESDRVRMRIVDDGRGIDRDEVVRKAVRHKIVDPDTAAGLDQTEVFHLLFEPGFSTIEETTEISGRGIGLDAVAARVRSVGGDLWLESEFGKGTSLTVEVPVARRGERVLVLKVGRHQIALPAAPVRAYRRVSRENVSEVDGRRRAVIGGRTITARFLADVLGEPPPINGVLVEMVVGGGVIGIVADAVLTEEEVIVHPLPAAAGAPAGIDGITLLSSGRPVAVLSLQQIGPLQFPDRDLPPLAGRGARPIRVLLVDDSDVTREMIRRLLEDAGFVVTSVGGAEDALEALAGDPFDCLVTDIEMPGIDGLDLTRKLRQTEGLADLPIVVVSTLDRPADRLAGLESGADGYLTKQGLDARELVALIRRVGGGHG